MDILWLFVNVKSKVNNVFALMNRQNNSHMDFIFIVYGIHNTWGKQFRIYIRCIDFITLNVFYVYIFTLVPCTTILYRLSQIDDEKIVLIANYTHTHKIRIGSNEKHSFFYSYTLFELSVIILSSDISSLFRP